MSNSWKGLGRLGGDPEVRYVNTNKGQVAVVGFSLAVPNRKGVDPETNWFRCEAWGSGGELIAKYFGKGDLIDISDAEIRQENWEDKTTGEKRSGVRFRVYRFDFVPTNTRRDKSPEDNGTGDETPPPFEGEKEETPKAEPAKRRPAAAGAGARGKRAATPAVEENEDDPDITF